MIQKIIVAIIVGIALIIAINRIFKALFKKQEDCSGCSSSDCCGCPLEDLKKDIKHNNSNKKSISQ